jgi:septum formation protein
MRFILASASPARLAALRAAGVEPEVMVSGIDEDAIRGNSVARLVAVTAEAKARAVSAALRGDALVLGCDSLLELDGQPLGKPGNAKAATDRWLTINGRRGVLHTGHALLRIRAGEIVRDNLQTASTTIQFAELSLDEIVGYVATGEPLQVAGAFTIDGLGGWFVESIEGDHHNVVGISLPLLRRMVMTFGLALSDLGYPHTEA